MRRLLLALALVALHVTGVAAQTVQCDGRESGGTGTVTCDPIPRDYAYPVFEDSHSGPIYDVYIGTDDGVAANYTNICMPVGWTFSIVNNPPGPPYIGAPIQGSGTLVKTPHGGTAGVPTLATRFVIHFSSGGAGMGLPGGMFTFGFDNPLPSFDVQWHTVNAGGPAAFAWGAPVGLGTGPVHAPLDHYPDPNLSTAALVPPPTINPFYVFNICPQGDVQTLMQRQVAVNITLVDSFGRPIAGHPANAMQLRIAPTAAFDNIVMCDGTRIMLVADGPTNFAGQARMTGKPRPGGGYLMPGGYCMVYVWNPNMGGWVPITTGPTSGVIDIIFNSPDNTGDLVVNLADVAVFAQDLFGVYHYRSDLVYDSAINLADVAAFAPHIGHVCP